MASLEFIAYECTRRLENNQLNKFSTNYEGKGYTVIFKQFNDNSNDFLICRPHLVIYANLNNFDKYKRT